MLHRLGDRVPKVDESAWIADTATVIGSVEIMAEASVWFGAVIRGDNDRIRIGARTNVQDLSMLHTDDGIELSIGEGVTVGHAVVLHGCSVGDGSLIGIGSVVLNRAKIGKNVILGAKSLVPEGREIPDSVLALGSPARVIRPLTEQELRGLRDASAHYVAKAKTFRATMRRS
jgi:carbonic anhydrase/acetyltransferase-like protein (isoleucine patch superfamily)